MTSNVCPEEQAKQSVHSPGIVKDCEWLHRVVLYPKHVDKKGQLKPSAISKQDLKQRGFSVYRQRFADWNQVQSHLKTSAEKHGEMPAGTCRARCREVRNVVMRTTFERMLCVHDTAIEDNPAHAEIKKSRAQNDPHFSLEGLRADLADAFSYAAPVPENSVWKSCLARIFQAIRMISEAYRK